MAAGCEVLVCRPSDSLSSGERAGVRGLGGSCDVTIPALLDELGRRRMTNVVVEGGGQLLGALFDAGAIDEVHVFIAPKIIGGSQAPTAMAGLGLEKIAAAHIVDVDIQHIGDELYIRGPIKTRNY